MAVRMTASLSLSLVVLSGCGEVAQSSDTGLTSTTSVPAPTTSVPTPTNSVATPTTIDRVDVMAKIEELFASGDLLGVEVSIDSLTGEIVVYSDDLTPDQQQRIEEVLGGVTYYRDIRKSYPPEPGVLDDTFPEEPTIAVRHSQISPDRRTVALSFIGNCDPHFKGWARVNGDVLEVAVTSLGWSTPRCPLIEYTNEVIVALDEPFKGTEIRDLASDFVLILERP